MKIPLCNTLGIAFPLFGFSHCRDVVAAVSKAGAFGVLGATSLTPDQLKIDLDWIDAQVNGAPYGIDLAIPENMPIRDERNQNYRALMERIPAKHYDFVNALLQQHDVDPIVKESFTDKDVGYMHDTTERLMDEAFRHPIRFIVQALGRPPQSMIDRAKARGIPTGVLVGSKEHAVRQLLAGVDVLVAQGTEAAAHCGEITTMVLIPEICAAVQEIRPVPVLAGGGIVTGRQMAAAMTMGAAGAWTGSVWLPTVESDISAVVREKLLGARSRDTIRSRALSGKPARQLRTIWSESWDSPNSPGPLQMPFQSLLADTAQARAVKSAEGGNKLAGDLITYGVGQGVGMLNSVSSVREAVREFMEDFANALERMRAIAD